MGITSAKCNWQSYQSLPPSVVKLLFPIIQCFLPINWFLVCVWNYERLQKLHKGPTESSYSKNVNCLSSVSNSLWDLAHKPLWKTRQKVVSNQFPLICRKALSSPLKCAECSWNYNACNLDGKFQNKINGTYYRNSTQKATFPHSRTKWNYLIIYLFTGLEQTF